MHGTNDAAVAESVGVPAGEVGDRLVVGVTNERNGLRIARTVRPRSRDGAEPANAAATESPQALSAWHGALVEDDETVLGDLGHGGRRIMTCW